MITDKKIDHAKTFVAKDEGNESDKRSEGARQEKKSSMFSFGHKKSKIEALRKKIGGGIISPIMADHKAVTDSSLSVLERYAVKEPVEYITIARDEVGSPVYLIEEPGVFL